MLGNRNGLAALIKRRSKSKNERKGLFRKKEAVLQVAAARSYPGLPIQKCPFL